MNKKIRDTIFFIICFTLIFNNIPEILQLNSIGGFMGKKLVIYPLIIGLIYTYYCQYKYKNVCVYFKQFRIFLFIYTVLIMISFIVGLYIYPYYSLIVEGPMEQINKISNLIYILKILNINIDQDTLVIFWMIIRNLKNLLLETIYTFLGSYMIFCWYYKEWKSGWNILEKSINVSLGIVLIYCSIEIFYLAGNEFAKNILINITPFFHYVEEYGTWWPPLLWKNQLRSVFEEPSYFGMYATFIMPFLWYRILTGTQKKNMLYNILVLIAFLFCLFLTKSRMATCLFLVEYILFLLIFFGLKKNLLYKKYMIITMCLIISFFSANVFISYTENNRSNTIDLKVNQYVNENITSITTTDKRSNNTRYSVMIADLHLGLDYPFLGVGYNLRNAYVLNYLPKMSDNNKEINKWIEEKEKMGILKKNIPKLGEYTSRFSETGFLGLFIFFIPPFILFKCFIKKIRNKKLEYNTKLIYLIYLISFIGVLSIGIGDTINNTYYYWILLGLGYAICLGDKYTI